MIVLLVKFTTAAARSAPDVGTVVSLNQIRDTLSEDAPGGPLSEIVAG